MHITELRLTKSSRNLVKDAQAIHRTLAHALDGSRHLWAMPRIETLVIASDRPVRKETLPGIIAESHSGQLPIRWETGSRVRFALIANPTRRAWAGQGKRGTIQPLPETEWEGWAVRKLAPIRVEHLIARHHNVATGARCTGRVTITQVAYAGVGIVKDTDGLEALIRNGVGRGKAYGCGLLLVMPV